MCCKMSWINFQGKKPGLGKALDWINLESHHMQQSVGYDWFLEFNGELPLRGLYFTEVICTGGEMDMNLRSGRKTLELAFVLKEKGREAVPSRRSAEAMDGLERPLLVPWQGVRQQEQSCQDGGDLRRCFLLLFFNFL